MNDRAEEIIGAMHDIGDDIGAMTQQESIEFYEAIARDAQNMADTIRREMRRS